MELLSELWQAIVGTLTFYLFLFLCVIVIYYLIIQIWKSKDKKKPKWIYCLLVACILSSLIIFLELMLTAFNGGSWYFEKEVSCISTDMSDWGDFATCVGTLVAIVSIYFVYKAFISQVTATRIASFDTTFTQIFAQHHVLYEKVIQHNFIYFPMFCSLPRFVNRNNNIFSLCRNEYIRASSRGIHIVDFWDEFNRKIGLFVSVDFKNYFKYIYHEIDVVVSQDDEVLSVDNRLRYIQLIQAQMNYDELLCYFINQVEYLIYWNDENRASTINGQRAIQHAENLQRLGFFNELCKSRSRHRDIVRNIMDRYPGIADRFICRDWFS